MYAELTGHPPGSGDACSYLLMHDWNAVQGIFWFLIRLRSRV